MPRWNWGVIAGAALIALVAARPFAGGWNDGSRLAMVEALVDHHTLALDQSIFVFVPPDGPSPYIDGSETTKDKLFIDGHWYCDKSPVPGLFLALVYWMLQAVTGLVASNNPAAFCYLMTVASSGAAYVLAVACVERMARILGLARPQRWLLTLSFALATTGLIYVQHVNNHVLFLGIASLLTLVVLQFATDAQQGTFRWSRLAGIGALAGAAYAVDMGLGPPLLAATFFLVAWRTRRLTACCWFVAAALPWVMLHHAVNWMIGGTLQPAASVPEYLAWEGSPFSSATMTGQLNHATPLEALSYGLQMLIGRRGFLLHNLPLFLLVPTLLAPLARASKVGAGGTAVQKGELSFTPEMIWSWSWCALGGLVYAMSSNNYSGACLTVRWFVPFLAAAYFLMALQMRAQRWIAPLLVLSLGGVVLMALAWKNGPWALRGVPGFWFVVAATFGGWLWVIVRQRRIVSPESPAQVFQTRVPIPAAAPAPEQVTSSQ